MQFKDSELEAFWDNPFDTAFRNIPATIKKPLFRRLQMLDAAYVLEDLRIPPGNHLEKLKSDRLGQYSIRVNDQWRLCFVWEQGEARGVELVDYH